jgi:hypothetical protein
MLSEVVSAKFGCWVIGLPFFKTQHSCSNKEVSKVPAVSLLSVGVLVANCS